MRPAAIQTMRSEPMATDRRPVTMPPVTEPAVLTAMMTPFQRLPWSGDEEAVDEGPHLLDDEDDVGLAEDVEQEGGAGDAVEHGRRRRGQHQRRRSAGWR